MFYLGYRRTHRGNVLVDRDASGAIHSNRRARCRQVQRLVACLFRSTRSSEKMTHRGRHRIQEFAACLESRELGGLEK